MANSKPPFYAAMQRALEEARLWLGATAPNPPVGAVAVDKYGNFLAVSAHQKAGQPHAEAALIDRLIAEKSLDKVDYIAVTLEPCNHHGKTPPCTQAILDAKIRRVVIGAGDPNPFVAGGGADRLRMAGVEIIEGVANDDCRKLIHAFSFFALHGKPFVTVKRAFRPLYQQPFAATAGTQMTMLPENGQKTFTAHEGIILAHKLRKKADAIITGSGTILSDRPLFTVRSVADHKNKRRLLAILDRRNRTPKDYLIEAEKRGLDPLLYSNLDACFEDLRHKGIQDVLVEAGPELSNAVLSSNHWAMRIDVLKGKEHHPDLAFNPSYEMPFDKNNPSIDRFLPS